MKIGIYIHVPFCVKKCGYCDFTSFAGKESLYKSYYNALINEIKKYPRLMLGDEQSDNYSIDSIFIGGGTPTVLPPDLICGIIDSLPGKKIISGTEITLEANPGTVDYEYLKAIKSCGVNRLSFGLQACDDRLLAILGRIHNYRTFEKNYNQAVKLGFKNINVDLMFALPEQSLNDWNQTLDTVLELSPSSVSAYALTIEENSPFGLAQREGRLKLPDEITDREMYYLAKQKLTEKKYKHVEISYFAKPGYECRHNLKYWTRKEYLGFGLNAHSFFRNTRYRNTAMLEEYIAANGDHTQIIRDSTEITPSEAISEYIFLGLRLINGIQKSDFQKKFGADIYDIYGKQIKKLISQGLISDFNGRIFLTDSGLDLANIAMSEF